MEASSVSSLHISWTLWTPITRSYRSYLCIVTLPISIWFIVLFHKLYRPLLSYNFRFPLSFSIVSNTSIFCPKAKALHTYMYNPHWDLRLSSVGICLEYCGSSLGGCDRSILARDVSVFFIIMLIQAHQ